MSLDNPLKSASDYEDMFFGNSHDSFGCSLSSPLSDHAVSMVDYSGKIKPFEPICSPNNEHRLSTSSNASSGYNSGFDIKMETPDSSDDLGYGQASARIDQQLQQPLDSMVGNVTGDIDTSMEIYRELILRHLIQDIQATCTRLGINNDPDKWKPEESLSWTQEMSCQFQLGHSVIPHRFAMHGRELCHMTAEEFVNKCPEHGDTLHAQLQIWKTASEYSQQLISSSNGNQLMDEGGNEHSGGYSNGWRGYGPLGGSHATSDATNPGCSYDTSAPEWLAGFDPLAMDFNNANQANANQRGYADGSNGLSVQTFPNNGLHFAQNAHLLDSPCGSDSGVSSDFEDGDGSPVTLPGSGTGSIHLWQFIRELLDHPDRFRSCVRWLDRTEGLFKIEDSHKLARLWGQRKNRQKMNYDKLSRSLRQYYKKNIIRKTGQRQRLIYQFVAPYHLL